MATTAGPDLAAVKARQQATWASGDFSVVGARIALTAERLVDAADLRAGWRVLDVATGSGNAAIAAARLGCAVTGVDYVPALLERGRERAAAERLDVDFVDGDAEALPFMTGTFEAAVSVFGCMFAPDQARAAAELRRVVRPGGRIALASWTPDGFIGDMFRVMSAHVPPPAGVAPPVLWGVADHVRLLFGRTLSGVNATEETFTFRYASPEALVAEFRTTYGPTVRAFAALDEAGREALQADLVDLCRRWDRLGDGATAIPATYLQVTGEAA